jgi:hypothetical protein
MLLFNKKHQFEDLIAYCTQENLQKTNLPQIGFFANKAS